jgi:hypothetical protein
MRKYRVILDRTNDIVALNTLSFIKTLGVMAAVKSVIVYLGYPIKSKGAWSNTDPWPIKEKRKTKEVIIQARLHTFSWSLESGRIMLVEVKSDEEHGSPMVKKSGKEKT